MTVTILQLVGSTLTEMAASGTSSMNNQAAHIGVMSPTQMVFTRPIKYAVTAAEAPEEDRPLLLLLLLLLLHPLDHLLPHLLLHLRPRLQMEMASALINLVGSTLTMMAAIGTKTMKNQAAQFGVMSPTPPMVYPLPRHVATARTTQISVRTFQIGKMHGEMDAIGTQVLIFVTSILAIRAMVVSQSPKRVAPVVGVFNRQQTWDNDMMYSFILPSKCITPRPSPCPELYSLLL